MAKTKKKTTKKKDAESIKKLLTIKDRFAIIGLLPKQGDIITMLMVRDIEIRMTITQTEKDKHKFRKTDIGWVWDFPQKRKSFTFSGAEMELIRSKITELDKQKKINADSLDTCLLMRE